MVREILKFKCTKIILKTARDMYIYNMEIFTLQVYREILNINAAYKKQLRHNIIDLCFIQ